MICLMSHISKIFEKIANEIDMLLSFNEEPCQMYGINFIKEEFSDLDH